MKGRNSVIRFRRDTKVMQTPAFSSRFDHIHRSLNLEANRNTPAEMHPSQEQVQKSHSAQVSEMEISSTVYCAKVDSFDAKTITARMLLSFTGLSPQPVAL